MTYQIGTDPGDYVHIRVHKNAGGGFFSPEWSALKDILEAIAKIPGPITAVSPHKLFRGKSVSSAGKKPTGNAGKASSA